jgi:starch phosphorylase
LRDRYWPRQVAATQPELMRVLDAIGGGMFSPGEAHRYRALVDGLLNRDRYFLIADFADYIATQSQVDACFAAPAAWDARALHNIAGMGYFSADRCVREYAERIWGAAPAPAA